MPHPAPAKATKSVEKTNKERTIKYFREMIQTITIKKNKTKDKKQIFQHSVSGESLHNEDAYLHS